MTEDQEWIRRHVALMRTQRGHWCFVPGCTGSQPLAWVPTEAEARTDRPYRDRAIDIPPRRSALDYYLDRHRPTLHVGMTGPSGDIPIHIHWGEG